MLSENKVGVGYVSSNDGIIEYSFELCQKLVRKAMLSAGLGDVDNKKPLLDLIKPGCVVLLKPNWVNHLNNNVMNTEPLITHQNLIEAVVVEVSHCAPKKIIIGDAPIQGCEFAKLFSLDWVAKINALAKCPVEIIDFRRSILNKADKDSRRKENVRDINNYILFDLEDKSLLEPVSSINNQFRVTMYDSKLLNHRQKIGRHQYLIAKEVFNADVIINLPKLKTHRKAGLTGACKNVVGLNGNKEFLAHHRVGGSGMGGDCYKGKSYFKRLAEYFLDRSNTCIGRISSEYYLKIADIFMAIAKRFGSDDEIEGGWHGNDTVWRMTLDINTILLYGKLDGTVSENKERQIYSLTDAIIAGDAEGPLSVDPVPLGVVTFAASSVFADLVHAALMRFDWEKIPTIKNALNLKKFQLTSFNVEDCEVVLNRKQINVKELSEKIGINFRAPKNWQGFIEVNGDSD